MSLNSTAWSGGAWSEGEWSGFAADVVAVDQDIIEPTALSITPESLSVAFEISSASLSTWRQYGRAGDLERIESHGGQYRIIDDGDAETVKFGVGDQYHPAIERGSDWYVDTYAESQIAPNRYEIELELLRSTNRVEAASKLTQTGAFEIDLSHGTIGLDDRSVGQIDREGSPVGEVITLPLLLSSEQAGAIGDAAGSPGGVVERPVPDGDDQLDDTSGRQSATISTPTNADLAGGDYLIRGWEIEFYSHNPSHRWQATLTITET